MVGKWDERDREKAGERFRRDAAVSLRAYKEEYHLALAVFSCRQMRAVVFNAEAHSQLSSLSVVWLY